MGAVLVQVGAAGAGATAPPAAAREEPAEGTTEGPEYVSVNSKSPAERPLFESVSVFGIGVPALATASSKLTETAPRRTFFPNVL